AEFAHELTTKKADPPAQLIAAATPPRRNTGAGLPGMSAASGPSAPAVPAPIVPARPERPDGTLEVISRDVMDERTVPAGRRATEDSFGDIATRTVDKSRVPAPPERGGGIHSPGRMDEPSIKIEDDDEGIPQLQRLLSVDAPVERVEFPVR